METFTTISIGLSNKLKLDKPEDDHLEEAATTHNFPNEEEKKAWLRNIEALGKYYEEDYESKVKEESND